MPNLPPAQCPAAPDELLLCVHVISHGASDVMQRAGTHFAVYQLFRIKTICYRIFLFRPTSRRCTETNFPPIIRSDAPRTSKLPIFISGPDLST